jgi:hypothetical protein
MTRTRLSPLSVLYMEVVLTTSNCTEFKQFSLLYALFQQVSVPTNTKTDEKGLWMSLVHEGA